MKPEYYYKSNNTQRYIYMISSSIDHFMKYNPPCKECLIQNMCLTEYEYDIPNEKNVYYEMTIELCERMEEFMNNDIDFNDEFGELRD